MVRSDSVCGLQVAVGIPGPEKAAGGGAQGAEGRLQGRCSTPVDLILSKGHSWAARVQATRESTPLHLYCVQH